MISSYTPSISALVHALDSHPQFPHTPSISLIAQPAAIGQNWLPGTKKELKLIVEKARDVVPVTTFIESEASIEKVKETSSSVHFACHGLHDAKDPTKSALLLAGSSRLTLSEIIMMKLPPKDVAFLSACQTARGDEKLSDEAVHLAAGMLLAGYQGVIATMWSIGDMDAPQVANDVYEVLLQEPQDAVTNAAKALHLAVQKL